jgi:carbon storage regulator
MLILTRKIDQTVLIQGGISVMILGVERDRVKLGISAPYDIAILREELYAQACADVVELALPKPEWSIEQPQPKDLPQWQSPLQLPAPKPREPKPRWRAEQIFRSLQDLGGARLV